MIRGAYVHKREIEVKMTRTLRVRFASLSWWQSFGIKTREEGIRCVKCKPRMLASPPQLKESMSVNEQKAYSLAKTQHSPRCQYHRDYKLQTTAILARRGSDVAITGCGWILRKCFHMFHVLPSVVVKWIAEILLINSGLVAWKLSGPLQSRKDSLSVECLINTAFRSLIFRYPV